ncbi:MAG: hypothetical protein ACYCVH_08465 [Ignavibacteriaceae bacterium]
METTKYAFKTKVNLSYEEAQEIVVAAIDPVASMMAVGNNQLGEVAAAIQNKLKSVIKRL